MGAESRQSSYYGHRQVEEMTDTFPKAERSRIMAAVKSKDTAPEMTVRRLVHSLGYRYRLHVKSLPGSPDLAFPRLKKVINVSGCFWHMHGCGRCRMPSSRETYWREKLLRNYERDKKTARALRKAGWGLLVVWECQIMRNRADWLKRRLLHFLSQRCDRGPRNA